MQGLRAVALWGLICALLRGQVPAGPQEITFNLVACDKKGKPVRNLEPRDLKVWDNGQPVALKRLEFVSDGPTARQAVTLLVDHMETTGTSNAKRVAERLLKLSPNSGTDFAVFKIDGRLRLYQQATSDRELVRKAIRSLDQASSDSADAEKAAVLEAKTGAETGGKSLSFAERQHAKAVVAALGESQRMGRDLRLQSPLASLLALVRSEQGEPGRKAIVFFTSGLRMDLNTRELMRTLIGTANQAGVSIYAINANSLDSREAAAMAASIGVQQAAMSGHNSVAPVAASGPVIPANTSVGPGATTSSAENAGRIENGVDSQQAGLAELCASTAGRYLGNGDDLKYELRRMYGDLTNYYHATYAVQDMEYDGQFRRVQVKPVLKNVRVQARSGYLGLPPSAAMGPQPFEATLQKVLSQPHLPADFGFRCVVMQVGQNAETSALVIEIPLRDFQGEEDFNTGLYSMHVSMLAQIKNQSGTAIENFSADLPRRGALEAKDRMRSEVATVTRYFVAPAGDYTLEVAIQDRSSGMASAQRQAFRIAKMPAGAYLSDVSLVRRTEAFQSDADNDEPLQYEGRRIVPDLSDVVATEAKEVSFFFVVHPDGKSATNPKLEMEIRKDGRVVGRGDLALRESAGGKAIAYMASLKASSFEAGYYEAAALLTQGGQTVERVRAFNVAGPQLASAGAPMMPESMTTKLPKALTIARASGAVNRPADEALSALLSAAKQGAVDYTDSLPNVMCTEVTDRSADVMGTGGFRHQDTITELLRYHDKVEQRLMLGVDNKGTDSDRSAFKGRLPAASSADC